MAIEEHDRENLLRDGRTMLLRGECTIDAVTVVVGFRGQGQMSLYGGADPVFQFNTDRQLRRAYFQGTRFAAKNGHLVELTRLSRGGKVQFVSKPLDPAMEKMIQSSVIDWLQKLRDAVQTDTTQWRVVGDHADNFHASLNEWLRHAKDNPEIANTPHA